jgi:hypothetical protein
MVILIFNIVVILKLIFFKYSLEDVENNSSRASVRVGTVDLDVSNNVGTAGIEKGSRAQSGTANTTSSNCNGSTISTRKGDGGITSSSCGTKAKKATLTGTKVKEVYICRGLCYTTAESKESCGGRARGGKTVAIKKEVSYGSFNPLVGAEGDVSVAEGRESDVACSTIKHKFADTRTSKDGC